MDGVGESRAPGAVIDVIEKHREKKEGQQKRAKPELTEHQRQIGMELLKSADLVDRIDRDYTELGYVRERKNKILLYLVMTSRLMLNPLHAIIISRSSAGKSMLVEVTEQLCPPEDVDVDFLNTILSPEDLTKRIEAQPTVANATT